MDPHCVREGPHFLDLCAEVLSPPESPERTNFYVPHLCLYMIIYFKLSYISGTVHQTPAAGGKQNVLKLE